MVTEELLLDVVVGINRETQDSVVIKGPDRRRHTLITASNGVGRGEAFVIPILEQDLNNLVSYKSEKTSVNINDDTADFLSGITIIESTNDLCDKTLMLTNRLGIPEEAITYINPINPNTPSINPMRGEVDKVVRVFTEIVEDYYGVNENFFQLQIQRDHLKHYIYLLKLHDKDKDVTLDMLLDMYNNPQLVRAMHESLKTRLPSKIDEIKDRDERNYWKIAQSIDYWFNTKLLPVVKSGGSKSGSLMIPEYDENGHVLYEDTLLEQTSGLRAILNDMGANPKLRRVLFGTSDFDFDLHINNGGILLVNTAKHEIGTLSALLGKIILMNLQYATYNRENSSSTYHHIIIDELPEYIYPSFVEFPVVARKLKVILTVLQQTDVQIVNRFGQDYQDMLNTNLRNRILYDGLFDRWTADIIVNNKLSSVPHLKPRVDLKSYSY